MARKHGFFRPHVAGLSGIYSTTLREGVGVPNLLANSAWDGGSLPLAWGAAGATGTRIAGVSAIDAEDASLRFQATAQRPFVDYVGDSVADGDIFTFSFDVEDIVDVSTVTWSQLFTIAGVAFTVDYNGVATTNVLVSGLVVGQRGYARVTFAASGTPTYRFGLGAASNATGDITLSRPALKRGTSTSYTRTGLTADGPFDVIFDFGQSNTFSGEALDSGIDIGNARIFQLKQNGGVVAATEPLDHPAPAAGRIGHALAFARDYYLPNVLASGRNILIVPYGVNGSGFVDNEWNPGDPLYEGAVQQANIAMGSDPGNQAAALLWQQGETDAEAGVLQASYTASLVAMVAGLRSDIDGAEAMPITVGGLAPTWVAADAGRQPVQDALEAVAASISRSGYATSAGLTTHDGIHYDAASQRTLASKHYDAYKIIRNGFSNSPLAGGTLPTGYSAPGSTGTRTADVSTIDPDDNAIRFQATAQRPFLQQSKAVLNGSVWTLSCTVEAVVDVSAVTWGRLFGTSGVAGTFNYNGVDTTGTALVGTLTPGQRIFVTITHTAGGTQAFRFGLGVAASATGDVTLSQPLLVEGTDTEYFRRA